MDGTDARRTFEKRCELKGTKRELKEWIRRTISVKGDRILWGQKLTGEMRRNRRGDPGQEDDDGSRQQEEQEEAEEEDVNGDIVDEEEETEQDDRGVVSERSEGPNQQDNIIKRKQMKTRKKYCKEHEKLKRQEGRTMTRTRGRVTWNLPRAGLEPSNLGKGGFMLPESMKGKSSGELFMLWCHKPLTLMSCMMTGLRQQAQQKGRNSKKETRMDKELGDKSRTGRKMEAWPRSGVG